MAGASGGVYALIAAHLANVIFNWKEMEFPWLRLLAFLLLAGVDTSVAVYYRVNGVDTKVSYVAHIAGKNRKLRIPELPVQQYKVV